MSNDCYETKRMRLSRAVEAWWYYDHDHVAPWEEHDGHGPVRAGRYDRDKRPWERPLNGARSRSTRYLYDWRAAMKLATQDGWWWCTNIDTFMHLTARHRRVPTRGMIAEYACTMDFEYLRGWLNDEWCWCGIVVIDEETGVEAALWGIESTNEHGYHEQVIQELVDEMYVEVVEALLAGVKRDAEYEND